MFTSYRQTCFLRVFLLPGPQQLNPACARLQRFATTAPRGGSLSERSFRAARAKQQAYYSPTSTCVIPEQGGFRRLRRAN